MSIWNYKFDEPRPLPNCTSGDSDKVEKISDADGRKIYCEAIRGYRNIENHWSNLERLANEGRKGSNNYEAAYLYLAMAAILSDSSVKQPKTDLNAATAYHNAGHAFRECGQLNRAGDAYWRSALAYTSQNESSQNNKARSFSRAKACYAEVGDIEKADNMHRCEWQARREARGRKSLVLGVWFVTSEYGTSVRRWLTCLGVFIAAFTVAYQVLETFGVIKAQTDWIFGLSAFYFSVTTSLPLDHISVSGWISILLVLLNLTLANTLLAIGATVLGQKILRR